MSVGAGRSISSSATSSRHRRPLRPAAVRFGGDRQTVRAARGLVRPTPVLALHPHTDRFTLPSSRPGSTGGSQHGELPVPDTLSTPTATLQHAFLAVLPRIRT